MTNTELINIYETTYKEEFDKHFEMVNTLSEQARDKKYALQFGLGIMTLMLAFRNSFEIEKEIMQAFEHHFKLGGSVADTIRSIPDIIERHKKVAKEWHDTHKNEVSVEWKKFLGIIPYGIKQFHLKPSIRMGSTFEDMTTETEIASELGRQRAMIDLVNQLNAKYFELGGLEEFKASGASPIPLDTLVNLKTALSNNDLELFFKIVQSIFASMSYDMKIAEGFFQSHIHLLLTLLDTKILSELETNKGRIDSVVETENYIHIIEFKQNDSSIAIEQIRKKEYYQRFFTTKKKIILVGVAVDTSERNIIDWQMQTYK